MAQLTRACRRAAIPLAGGFAAVVLLASASGGAVAQEKAGTKAEVVLKRRVELTDEELRKQLQFVQETGLNQGSAADLYAPISKGKAEIKTLAPDLGPRLFKQITVQAKRDDQFALPWRSGPDCEMGKEAAERLHVLSTKLRDSLRKSVKKDDIRPDAEALRDLLDDAEWATPEAIPTLMQMMQAENTPVRALLVEMLSKMKGKDASVALATRALFDLSPDVRQKAVRALAARPAAEFKPVLYYGLRYPWPAAADHAAEAIVALEMTDLVPDLVRTLKEPAPGLPVKGDQGYFVQEVVRINHLCNCMLCHAPSLSKDDLVRGRVPMPGEDPPPLYYAERTGIFVRADLTYLRQDFSIVQPVPNAGKWPGNQRYDYVLRTRPLTRPELTVFQKLEKENKLPKTYPQQGSVIYALKQLTKADVGENPQDWIDALPKLTQPPTERPAPSPAQDASELVPTITDVTVSLDPETKRLRISVLGQVPTASWKDARLVRRNPKDAPQDGIYEYELRAVRPGGNANQASSEVKARANWDDPPADLKGVRVLGVGDGVRTAKLDK